VKPNETNSVVCKYRGTLLDGTEFDSSERVGKSVQFNVSEIMLGWQEALKLMAEGSIWQIFIPPHLAYGLRGGAGCWSKRNPDFRNRATEC
jgi:FKBP-type peptidyl-prolyl cis-trans isomerase FklB